MHLFVAGAAQQIHEQRYTMSIVPNNRLREVREEAGIEVSALASSAGVSERILKRIETIDGTSRTEIKERVVTGLNTLLGSKRYQTNEIFPGWQVHRRVAKRLKASAPKAAAPIAGSSD
jgi:predicted transcriptional regulator